MNNSVRRRQAKQEAKLVSQAEREARGWVHPADRPPKLKPTAMNLVRDMIQMNNMGVSLFSKAKGIK